MTSTLSAFFPPSPSFTDKNLPNLDGKVYIITGAASGVGYELAKMLYLAGGTVYISARSTSRCDGAIKEIQNKTQKLKTNGKLKPLALDLSDLSTIKPAVEQFLKQEIRLDVLVNNAGVMNTPLGSKGAQGHDLEMVTNCVGPYLLTNLLEPILTETAASSPPLSVRIIFVVALMQLYASSPVMSFDNQGNPAILPGDNYMKSQPGANYMQTKVGGTWLAAEFAARLQNKGILSVSVHPGLMRTELQRNMTAMARISMKLMFKSPAYGAYSELFAAFSPELKAENNGGYVLAWGRLAELPKHILDGLKSKIDGGTGEAKMFVDYCERETLAFK